MDQKNQEKNTNTDITLFGLFATAVTLIASLVYQYSKDVLTTEFQMNSTICKSQNITVTQEHNTVVPTFLSEYVLIAVFSLFMMISFMWAYVYSNEDKIGKINREFFRNTAGEFLDSFIILSISVVVGLFRVSTKNNICNIMDTITGITLLVILFFVVFIMLIYVTMGKLDEKAITNNKKTIVIIITILASLYFLNKLLSLIVILGLIILIVLLRLWSIYKTCNNGILLSSLAFLYISNLIVQGSVLNLSALYILIFVVKFAIDNKILPNSDNSSNNSARGGKSNNNSNNNNQRKPDNDNKNDNKPDNGWTCFEICIRPKDP